MKDIGFKFFGVSSKRNTLIDQRQLYMEVGCQTFTMYKNETIYKNSPTKIEKGRSHWDYEEVEVVGKTKKVYKKEDKDEFMELVFGEWNYFGDTRSLTKADFPRIYQEN